MQLSADAQNDIVAAVAASFDAGVADLTGDIQVYDAAQTTLIGVFTDVEGVQDPGFSVIGDTATLLGTPLTQPSASNTGVVARLQFRNRDNAIRWRVGVASDMSEPVNMANPSVTMGEPIVFSSYSITQPQGTP